MRAAGIRQIGDAIELLEFPAPRALRPDEVLLDVQACGVGNWDELARTGGWDLGVRPPMALGVETFGQSGQIGELYRHYGLDAEAILDAAAHALL